MTRRELATFVVKFVAGLAVFAILIGCAVATVIETGRANRASTRNAYLVRSNSDLSKAIATICDDPRAKAIPACSVVGTIEPGSYNDGSTTTTVPSGVTQGSTTSTVPNDAKISRLSTGRQSSSHTGAQTPGTVTRTITVPTGIPPTNSPQRPTPVNATTTTTTTPGLIQSLLGLLGL